MSKNPVMNVAVTGVHCDAPGCDYKEELPDFNPDHYLGKPCPKCKTVLFTAADYADYKKIFGAQSMMNTVADALEIEDTKEDPKLFSIRVTESGGIEFTNIDEEIDKFFGENLP